MSADMMSVRALWQKFALQSFPDLAVQRQEPRQVRNDDNAHQRPQHLPDGTPNLNDTRRQNGTFTSIAQTLPSFRSVLCTCNLKSTPSAPVLKDECGRTWAKLLICCRVSSPVKRLDTDSRRLPAAAVIGALPTYDIARDTWIPSLTLHVPGQELSHA